MISAHSGKKVWWICSKGHNYQASIGERTRQYKGRNKTGSGCPICSGRKVLKGYNDLQTLSAELCNEWDYEKNSKLTPEMTTATAGRKVWWKCPLGHSYEMEVGFRYLRKYSCPICSGRRVSVGFNDLLSCYPEIAKEWNYDKNGDLRPDGVTGKSNKNVWWKCESGHEWKAKISNRVIHKQKCPYCSGRVPIAGETDLATISPMLAEEWDVDTNAPLTPKQVKAYSNRKVSWICKKCGYKWEATVNSRMRGNGCPRCAGRIIITGENDLATTNPELVEEWAYDKNGALTPRDISHGYDKPVWWRCKVCGRYWKANVYNRANPSIRSGCPFCAKGTQTSFQEQAILYYLRDYYEDVINNDRSVLEGKELDIFIPWINAVWVT